MKKHKNRVCDENYIKLNKFALAMKLIRLSVQCKKMGKTGLQSKLEELFSRSPLKTCFEKVQP
jgi:hypothetical protein